MTITEFLEARIAEDEAVAREALTEPWAAGSWTPEVYDDGIRNRAVAFAPKRVLAECTAKRRIVELHRRWPVLVEQPEPTGGWSHDPAHFVYAASMRIEWLTQQQYREKFGDEPPTAPIIAAMAAVYDSHPDYDEAWRP